MKKYYVLLCLFFTSFLLAQVGINTTTPNAQLDIQSSNQAAPSNTDGMLIPKVDTFPVTNPTIDQQGMLVYLTTNVGSNPPGFYYWDNSTTTWIPIKGTDTGTLDQAYDFGGAGNGRIITADAGAVTIAGTDGLVSTGTFGTGAVAPSGNATRMVWNPRKAAFRAGRPFTQWDDVNIGFFSVAFGTNTIASGNASAAFGEASTASSFRSMAFGSNTTASGPQSTAFGNSTIASGGNSTAFGNNTNAIGDIATAFGVGTSASGSNSTAFGNSTIASGGNSTAFGNTTIASGGNSTAFGHGNQATSFSETVLGIGATNYTPSTNGATQFRTANATDRLFVIGNAIDVNNNNNVDASERSDAMVVLKNGNVGVGISTPENKLHFHNQFDTQTFLQLTNGTTGTTANDGLIIGNTVFTGEAGIVNLENTNLYFGTSGDSNHLVINPNGNVAVGGIITAQEKLHVLGRIRMVDGNQATGRVLTSDANGTATWQNPTANVWGLTGNSGTNSLINYIGTNDDVDVVFKRNNIVHGRLGFSNTSFGRNANIGGGSNSSFGSNSMVSTTSSANSAFGFSTLVQSTGGFNCAFGGVSMFSNTSGFNNIGVGYQSLYNNTVGSFNTAVGVDALLANISGSENTAIGCYSGTLNNNLFNATAIGTRAGVGASNALVLGSISGVNGATSTVNVGIGTTTPQERLHVVGKTLLTNGFSADNAALLYQNNSNYMFIGPQSGSSANGAAIALFGSTNTSASNAGGMDINVPNALVRMNHTNGNFTFGTNSTSGYTGAFELNDDGLQIGHNSGSRAILFNPNNTERMRLTPTGNVGIGTNNPAQKLHVSGPAGLTAVRIGNTSTTGSTSNVALDFFRNSAANTDWRIYNIGANLTLGNSGDDLATINDLYQYQGVRFIPMTDATQNLGQAANRWNTLFASNGTINTSDAREKKNIQNIKYGLNSLMQLRPVSFEWNKDDGSGTKLGLIAQELQQVVPEVVRDWDWEEDEQGNRKKVASPILGVYYSDLIPVLIKATQEQQLIIEKQKQEIDLLKQQLQEQYKSIVERLEKIENR